MKSKAHIIVSKTRKENGALAATLGARLIREALRKRGKANIIVATGASQFEMLSELVKAQDIDWSRVTAFHLDEYIGLPISHPASFRRYLWERFVSRLPLPLAAFHYVDGERKGECARLGKLITKSPIDVAFVGIGENGHLAFNDPPANFKTNTPYIEVKLDKACRQQQLGEGWFKTIKDVPSKAISMSIRQIMKARAIICTVPDKRKAQAVKNCLSSSAPICPKHPASILRTHPATWIFLDKYAACGLDEK